LKTTATIEDNANYVYTICIDYTVPYAQSNCLTGVIEDNLVTSCSGSWNGVECQSCQVEPTLGGFDTVDFCYLLDCTNTELGLTLNDCDVSPDISPIYNNVHLSAGCEESCEICPQGSANGTADIETYAATGSYSCAYIFELGTDGYFSVDECSALQSTLPEVCGCTGSSAGDGSGADSPADLESGTDAPEGAAPSGSMPMYRQNGWSLVVKCAMMAGAVLAFGTEVISASI
jgi:hypothetical protein